MNAKGSSMSEHLQHLCTDCELCCYQSILSLIAKPTGFLPPFDIDKKASRSFLDLDRRSTAPSEKSSLHRQPPPRAALGIVAQIHPRGSRFLTKEIGQQIFPAVHTGRQCLHDQNFVVPIHDQARQSVGFSIDKPIGTGAGGEAPPEAHRPRQPSPPKLAC